MAESVPLRLMRPRNPAEEQIANTAKKTAHSSQIANHVHCDVVSNPQQSLPSPSVAPSQSSSDEATEQLQELSVFHKSDHYFMPNKSQVLFYLTDASLLRIRKTGTELQVTDSIDFPLFDIWIESDCVRSTWILESYGRTVLLISESSSFGCFFSRKKSEPPTVVITDWNGDLFGYFVPGNPFLVEDSDKQTVAKLIASDAGNGRGLSWMCILECSGREIARLDDYTTIRFANDMIGFQMKLLTLAAFVRLAASQNETPRSCFCSFLSSLLRF
uniref:Uncharacterized protein n=1 Tax=Parascaris univalens TaxID=6257 RepID=A0A914ZU61_PARUN